MIVDSQRQFEELSGMDEGDDGDGVESSNGSPLGDSGGGFPGGGATVTFMTFCNVVLIRVFRCCIGGRNLGSSSSSLSGFVDVGGRC